MKQLLFFILLLCCMSVSAKKQVFYSCSYKLIEPVDSGNVYSDSLFTIVFGLKSTNIPFTIENKNSQPIFIDWEQSALILHGVTKRCIHSGIKFTDKANPQQKTIIAPKSTLSELLMPADNVVFSSGKDPYGILDHSPHWIQKPIIRLDSKEDVGFGFANVPDEEIKSQNGMEIGIMLALEINGSTIYKTFRMVCFNIQQITNK